MSHYTEIKVEFMDPEALREALVTMGYDRDQIEVHKEAQTIYDYCNEPSKYRWNDHKDARFKDGDKAHVIVRQKHVGDQHNDLGWYLDKKTGSVGFICDYTVNDKGGGCKNLVAKKMHGHGKKWQDKLQQEYAFQVAKKSYRGRKMERVDEPDGTIRLFVRA